MCDGLKSIPILVLQVWLDGVVVVGSLDMHLEIVGSVLSCCTFECNFSQHTCSHVISSEVNKHRCNLVVHVLGPVLPEKGHLVS